MNKITNSQNQDLPIEVIESVINDQKLRTNLTKRNPLWFFGLYFSHYITFPIADFQREIFQIMSDESQKQVVITAFRGSAKSTLITLCYALWSIMGSQNKKFIVIISQTQELAKQHLKNIKRELEENDLLKADLGPFQEENEWGSGAIVLPKYNAKIMVASTEQSIRGIKHGPYRPDIIIADDVEDVNSTKTSDSRNKTYEWYNSEIVPLGDIGTRIIVVGNLLHEDSLVMRLINEMEDGQRTGIFRKYPIMDNGDNILWPGKYPDLNAIETEKLKVGDKFSFAREYMLSIVDRREAIVVRENIHYYKEVPPKGHGDYNVISTDLAVSLKESADYTAIISAKIIGQGKDRKIYILENPVNERLDFSQATDMVKATISSLGNIFETEVYVENVGAQDYFAQHLGEQSYLVKSLKVGNMDKRGRLYVSHKWISSGRVLFPEHGAEKLIEQILGFGVEKHDDLVDAFTLLVMNTIEKTFEYEGKTIGLLRF
ncbi:MAG TPA: hypothetical protein P5096_00135 [Patescibacteria group bacterium]|nr:hypothetical protein [Patescibacteria group bacterium]